MQKTTRNKMTPCRWQQHTDWLPAKDIRTLAESRHQKPTISRLQRWACAYFFYVRNHSSIRWRTSATACLRLLKEIILHTCISFVRNCNFFSNPQLLSRCCLATANLLSQFFQQSATFIERLLHNSISALRQFIEEVWTKNVFIFLSGNQTQASGRRCRSLPLDQETSLKEFECGRV